jgi:phosphomannomutase
MHGRGNDDGIYGITTLFLDIGGSCSPTHGTPTSTRQRRPSGLDDEEMHERHNAWRINLRASNTESLMRLNPEAKDSSTEEKGGP